MSHVLREGGFVLIVAGVFLLLLWMVWPRPRRHRHAPGESLPAVVPAPPGHWLNAPPDSEEFLRGMWGEHYGQPGEPGERLPLTPLPPRPRAYRRPAQVPHAAPDIPRSGPWLHPKVIEELGHATVDELVDSIVHRWVVKS